MLIYGLQNLLEFKWFLLVTVVLVLVSMPVFSILTREFQWNKRTRGLYAFFLALDRRHMIWIGFSVLRVTFALSCLLFQTEVSAVHLFFLLALGVGRFLWIRRPLSLVTDLFNGILIYVALMVENILTGYLRETRTDVMVLLVSIVMGISVIHYCIYFFVRDVEMIFNERSEKLADKEGENVEVRAEADLEKTDA